MNLRALIYLYLFLIAPTFAIAEDSGNPAERRERTKEYCDLNPLEEKCAKFLDSEYRRLKDAEKELKEDSYDRMVEQRYQKEKKLELLTFCRKNPDSERCPK